MILAQDALRWLTVKALRGRTWAGMRVYDSPSTPADLRVEEERQPFVCVYVDDGEVTFDGQSLSAADATVELIIEVAVASTMQIGPAPGGDTDPSDPDIDQAPSTSPPVKISPTDEGLEATIGFISAQCVQALLAPDNPWAELWRVLTSPGRVSADIRRGGSGQQSEPSAIRFAARLVKIRVKVLGDPIWGEPVTGFWEDFLVACEADHELRMIGGLVRAHIERPGTPMPAWEIDQAKGTWTLPGVFGIGIAAGHPALAPMPATEPPPLERGSVLDQSADENETVPQTGTEETEALAEDESQTRTPWEVDDAS